MKACALKIQYFFHSYSVLGSNDPQPAVGVQKATTRQHKGNVNSSSAGFQSRAGSQGVYLWAIHGANTARPSNSQIMQSPIQLLH